MRSSRRGLTPRFFGAIGTLLAENGINISSLELSRLSEHGEAMMFVAVDQQITPDIIAGLRSTDGMLDVRLIELPDAAP